MEPGAETILIHNSFEPGFPWHELHELLREPEIYNMQMEDGFPPPEEGVFIDRPHPLTVVWLVQVGDGFVGYGMMKALGIKWAEVHIGFKREAGGALKRRFFRWMLRRTFDGGIGKITAFVPVFNRPACVMAAGNGFEREGRIVASFFRNGHYVDRIVFGLTKAQFDEMERV